MSQSELFITPIADYDTKLKVLQERLDFLYKACSEQEISNANMKIGVKMYEKFLEDALMKTEGYCVKLCDHVKMMEKHLEREGIVDWLTTEEESTGSGEEEWQPQYDPEFVPVRAEDYGTMKSPINLN